MGNSPGSYAEGCIRAAGVKLYMKDSIFSNNQANGLPIISVISASALIDNCR
jgi:hypothetical protein